MNAKGYEKLDDVLARAYNQASQGKGAERHANELPFHEQPMQQVANQVGRGFLLGQAIKKIVEAQGLPADRAVAEMLGAINYIAGAVIHLEAQNDNEPLQSVSYSDECEGKVEYLDSRFQLVEVSGDMRIGFDWIRVPKGAMHFMNGFKGGVKAFYDKDFKKVYPVGDTNAWVKCWVEFKDLESNGGVLVWSRNPLPLTRDQARKILSNLRRGEAHNINGKMVVFNHQGLFVEGYWRSDSLKETLDYLFQEKS